MKWNDVILYVISKTYQNKTCLVNEYPDEKRGFFRFKLCGINEIDIQEMRQSFHSILKRENSKNLSELNEDMIAREEEWLNIPLKNNDIFYIDEKTATENRTFINVNKNSNNEKDNVYLYAFIIGLILNVYSVLVVNL